MTWPTERTRSRAWLVAAVVVMGTLTACGALVGAEPASPPLPSTSVLSGTAAADYVDERVRSIASDLSDIDACTDPENALWRQCGTDLIEGGAEFTAVELGNATARAAGRRTLSLGPSSPRVVSTPAVATVLATPADAGAVAVTTYEYVAQFLAAWEALMSGCPERGPQCTSLWQDLATARDRVLGVAGFWRDSAAAPA